MKNEKELTKKQKNYIENLKLILDFKNITPKKLDDEIPEVHASNLSNAFSHKRSISDANCEYIAEYLNESLEDMYTEGYARKKYYGMDNLDLLDVLRNTPYGSALLLLVAYYAVACSICLLVSSYREIEPFYVFLSVGITWVIIAFGDGMRKTTKTEISNKLLAAFASFVNKRKGSAIIVFSILEVLCCTKPYYETLMFPMLTAILLENSGIFSKEMRKEYKEKHDKSYFVILVFIKFIELAAVVFYCFDVYSNVFIK